MQWSGWRRPSSSNNAVMPGSAPGSPSLLRRLGLPRGGFGRQANGTRFDCRRGRSDADTATHTTAVCAPSGDLSPRMRQFVICLKPQTFRERPAVSISIEMADHRTVSDLESAALRRLPVLTTDSPGGDWQLQPRYTNSPTLIDQGWTLADQRVPVNLCMTKVSTQSDPKRAHALRPPTPPLPRSLLL